MSNPYAADLIVVGGGVMGLASAYYAAREGHEVLLLEQGPFGSRVNSSYGKERMYRLMYSDPYLAELAALGLDLWNALEREQMGAEQLEEKKLLSRNGLLFYGEWSEEETIEGSLGGAAEVMEQRGIPFEHLDSQGLAARFPVFQNMPAQFEGLFEGGSGFVYAERACRAFREGAQQHGAVWKTGVRVSRVQASADAVSILTEGGETFIGRRAILCPGAWTNDLLEPSFGIRLEVQLWHMDWAHYRVDSAWENDYPQWFCFSSLPEGENDPADHGLYYGFPSLQDGHSRIKVGVDWTDRICTSMDEFKYIPSEAILAKLDRFVRTQFKGIGERLEVACSPYTMSPDVRFVLDTIPNHPNVALFTAGSGQAFKFAPLIGQLLVELVYTGQTKVDIQPLNISRLLAA
jgi:sarcosine oxidase